MCLFTWMLLFACALLYRSEHFVIDCIGIFCFHLWFTAISTYMLTSEKKGKRCLEISLCSLFSIFCFSTDTRGLSQAAYAPRLVSIKDIRPVFQSFFLLTLQKKHMCWILRTLPTESGSLWNITPTNGWRCVYCRVFSEFFKFVYQQVVLVLWSHTIEN